MLKKPQQLRSKSERGKQIEKNISILSEEIKGAIEKYMPELLISTKEEKLEKNENILSEEIKDLID